MSNFADAAMGDGLGNGNQRHRSLKMITPEA